MTDDEIKALISTEIQKLQLSKEDAKGNAYYTATVNAWLNTRFEFDKSLLTLSAAGIGLAVTFITQFGIPSISVLALQVFAVLAFATSGGVVFNIYKKNADYLLNVANDKPTGSLKDLDGLAIVCFTIGIAFLFAAGIASAVFKLP